MAGHTRLLSGLWRMVPRDLPSDRADSRLHPIDTTGERQPLGELYC